MSNYITDKEIKENLLTTKQINEKSFFFTVQDLLDYIYKYNIDKNSPVFVERIEDFYFKKNGWKTLNKPDFEFKGHERKFFDIFGIIKFKNDNKLYLTAHF